MRASLTHTQLVIALALLALLSLPNGLHAQQKSGPRIQLVRDGNFGVRILVHAPDPVNAYDVELSYDESLVAIEEVNTANSIISVLPRPIRAAGGGIVIKGGSTTPFQGEAGELARIKLRPVGEGVALFSVVKAVAYAADGAGTLVALTTEPFGLRVTPGSFIAYEQALPELAASRDQSPPEITTAVIEENPLQFGERLLVFAAKDQETGVARYEARDRAWITWSPWREALNPYPVGDDAWAIQLKAVDNGGNASLATVYQFENALGKILVVLLSGILLYACTVFFRKHRG